MKTTATPTPKSAFNLEVINWPTIVNNNTIAGKLPNGADVTVTRYLHGWDSNIKITVAVPGGEVVWHDDAANHAERDQFTNLRSRALENDMAKSDKVREAARAQALIMRNI